MKKMFFIMMALLIALIVFADDYKILYMNTSSVKIGNRECRKGDLFSSDSIIVWTKERQAIKAQNLRNKEIFLFTERAFKSNNSMTMTIREYLFKTKHMSARATGLSLSELSELLNDTFDLLDTIRFESPVPMDSTRSYYIQYIKNDSTIEKKLPTEQDVIILSRTIFENCDSIEERNVRILFRSKSINEDYILTDSMRIVLVPFNIDNQCQNIDNSYNCICNQEK